MSEPKPSEEVETNAEETTESAGDPSDRPRKTVDGFSEEDYRKRRESAERQSEARKLAKSGRGRHLLFD